MTPFTSLDIIAFNDADWCGCVDDRKNTSAYSIFLTDCLVSWKCAKQKVVSRFSIESEYHALAYVTT